MFIRRKIPRPGSRTKTRAEGGGVLSRLQRTGSGLHRPRRRTPPVPPPASRARDDVGRKASRCTRLPQTPAPRSDVLWKHVARRLPAGRGCRWSPPSSGTGEELPPSVGRSRPAPEPELWRRRRQPLCRQAGSGRHASLQRSRLPGLLLLQRRSRCRGTRRPLVRSTCAVPCVWVNSLESHSGANALRALVAPESRKGRFFSRVRTSGSHAGSIAALVQRRADVAAIDCVTYALLDRYRPSCLAGHPAALLHGAGPGHPLRHPRREHGARGEAVAARPCEFLRGRRGPGGR